MLLTIGWLSIRIALEKSRNTAVEVTARTTATTTISSS